MSMKDPVVITYQSEHYNVNNSSPHAQQHPHPFLFLQQKKHLCHHTPIKNYIRQCINIFQEINAPDSNYHIQRSMLMMFHIGNLI